MHKVVVTGLGVVNALGNHHQDFWHNLIQGKNGIRPWQCPGVDDFPVKYASWVDLDQLPVAAALRQIWQKPMERRSRFGLVAAHQALQDANITQYDGLGVLTGSGVPEHDFEDTLLALKDGAIDLAHWFEQRDKINPQAGYTQPNDALATLIAQHYGCTGPTSNLSTACAGASQAIGIGFQMIRRGEASQMLVGGADSVLNMATMVGLHLLGAPSTTGIYGDALCRPFDRNRSGFVAAEGAGFVVLESEASALARGATIYAELSGYGSSLDAHLVTAPHPEGSGAILAMQRALQDAQLAPNAIQYINAHGTSTGLNDPIETKAIKQVFADQQHYQQLAVSSNKSQFGHLIAAAGAPELIATALTVRHGIIPPTLNLQNPDPECDLDYVPNQARPCAVQAALSNSFGFGGLNSALVVSRYE